jgi:DNA replication protein DnaC
MELGNLALKKIEELKREGYKSAEDKLKAEYRKGEIQLEEDEFLKDDLPYCKKCGGKRYYIIEPYMAVPTTCKCQQEEKEKQEEEKLRRRRLIAFHEGQRNSMLGRRYYHVTFENSIKTKNNKKAFETCKAYTDNPDAAIQNGLGLYIHGSNGTGKTHLTACICNELVAQGYDCIYTNLTTVLNELLNGTARSKDELMQKIATYDFLFFDDFGKEFLGRELKLEEKSNWNEQRLFEIVNTRYNANLPIIISSNYSLTELVSLLRLDKAIVDRLSEMTAESFLLKGDDFRNK